MLLRSTRQCQSLDIPIIDATLEFDVMNKSAVAARHCEGYRAYEQHYPRINIWMKVW